MSKLAFVFSGQGSQYVGMGKEIYEKYKCAQNVFDIANKSLGFDIKEMIFSGDEETLKITENTQPAIVTVSVAINEVLKEHGIIPDVVAGLSLGEYSAHVASRSIDFGDAVKLVRKRGKLMQDEVPKGAGTMAAIIGLSSEEVSELCDEVSNIGLAQPANYNCPGQIVISGETLAIQKIINVASDRGIKAIPLSVSAPFHCSMLKGAGEKLGFELQNINIREMNIPIVTNVTANIIKDKKEIKQLLIDQVSMPVRWEESVHTMLENGVTTFIEVGPGKVLSGFIKKIDRKLNVLNVEDINSLEKTIEKLNN